MDHFNSFESGMHYGSLPPEQLQSEDGLHKTDKIPETLPEGTGQGQNITHSTGILKGLVDLDTKDTTGNNLDTHETQVRFAGQDDVPALHIPKQRSNPISTLPASHRKGGLRSHAKPGPAWTELRTALASDKRGALDDDLLNAAMCEYVAHPKDERPQALYNDIFTGLEPTAVAIASVYAKRYNVLSDDLRQVAVEGIIKACGRFNPAAGNIVHFAAATIKGKLKRYFRNHSWSVRPPRQLQELYLNILLAESELTQQLGSHPTATQLAERLGVSANEIDQARDLGQHRYSISYHTPFKNSETLLVDTLGENDPNLELVTERMALRQALLQLDERSRTILGLYFLYGKTQTEIAAEVHLSQMYVSRLLKKAINEIRGLLGVKLPKNSTGNDSTDDSKNSSDSRKPKRYNRSTPTRRSTSHHY